MMLTCIYCGITVPVVLMLFLWPMSISAASLSFHSESDGPPCPGNTITYICNASETDRLIWTVTLLSIGETDTIEFIRPQVEQGSVQELIILDNTLVATLVQVTASDLVSNLTVTISYQLNEARVMCSNGAGAVSSGEILVTVPPSTPQNLMASNIPATGDSVLINLEWDIDFLASSELEGNYTISTVPTTMTSVTTNPHFILTLSFNTRHTVSVTATNCAGESTPAEIEVGPFLPPTSNSPAAPLAPIETSVTTERDVIESSGSDVDVAFVIAIAVPASFLVLTAILLSVLAVAVSVHRSKRNKGPPTITAPVARTPPNNIECEVIHLVHNTAYTTGSIPTTDDAGYEIIGELQPDYCSVHYNYSRADNICNTVEPPNSTYSTAGETYSGSVVPLDYVEPDCNRRQSTHTLSYVEVVS